MKPLYSIVLMLLLTVGAHAQEGKNIYNKYSDSQDVSAVYISPAMFRLVEKIPELRVDIESETGVDIAPLISSLQGFYMLNFSDRSVADALTADVDAMIRKGRYEMLMEVKDSGENIRIYTAGDAKTIESIVFIASGSSELQFICIDGVMNRNDVETLIAKVASN